MHTKRLPSAFLVAFLAVDLLLDLQAIVLNDRPWIGWCLLLRAACGFGLLAPLSYFAVGGGGMSTSSSASPTTMLAVNGVVYASLLILWWVLFSHLSLIVLSRVQSADMLIVLGASFRASLIASVSCPRPDATLIRLLAGRQRTRPVAANSLIRAGPGMLNRSTNTRFFSRAAPPKSSIASTMSRPLPPPPQSLPKLIRAATRPAASRPRARRAPAGPTTRTSRWIASSAQR